MKKRDVELVTLLEHIKILIPLNPSVAFERLHKLIKELKQNGKDRN